MLVSQQVKTVRSGVGTYARDLLAGLQRLHPDLGLCVATWNHEIDQESYPGVRFLDLGVPPALDPSPGAFFSLGKILARRLREEGAFFDVAHFLDAREGFACLAGQRLPAQRLLGTVHDDYAARAGLAPWSYWGRAADPLRRWLYYRVLRRLEKRCYPKYHGLLTNSQATALSLSQAYGLPMQGMQLTHLTAASPPPSPSGDGLKKLSGQPALLFAGGNFYRKGLDTLVRSLPLLLPSQPGTMLHVAGEDRLAQPRIQALAVKLGVAASLRFHGRVTPAQMHAFMQQADQYVMASRTEALGLVYLEAFAAGLPVVAGNRGGVTEIVRQEETGLTVPPEDPEALAVAILRLQGDAALRQSLQQKAKALVAGRTVERMLQETLQAYGWSVDGSVHTKSAEPLSGVSAL